LPIISLLLYYKPTISKTKTSKTVKTIIKVLDKTIKDRKDNKEEAPKDEAARDK